MRQCLLVVDVQATFAPPAWLVARIQTLAALLPTVALIERHDEQVTPFFRQLGWHPSPNDHSLIATERVFIKHGYAPTPEVIADLRDGDFERVLVCGIQTDTCVLAAGFALFDAGLTPTLVTDLTLGSSLDRSGQLGIALWRHHFRHLTTSTALLADLVG